MRKILGRIIALLASAALLLTGITLAPAWAVPSYPSWQEVEDAKKDVREKQQIIERLEELIGALELELDELSKVALIKNEEYNQALEAVREMSARVDSLQGDVDEAALQAEAAKAQLGQIAAGMYRTGTSGETSLELFFNPENAEDLLYQLGTQEIIATRTDAIYQQSVDKQANAETLQTELSLANDELEATRLVAADALEQAQAAADAVQQKFDDNDALNNQMVLQLADLKETSEDLARQRADGLAAEARQRAVGTPPVAPELYSVSGPNTALVEQAIDFAKQQLGERYVLGGAGPNVWDCSGITMKAYSAAGVYIGWHSATAQYNVMASKKKLVPFQDAQRGDLIWWSTSKSFNGDKYHVAIYLGDGMMLEAPNPARTVRIVPVRYGELWPYAGRPTASSDMN